MKDILPKKVALGIFICVSTRTALSQLPCTVNCLCQKWCKDESINNRYCRIACDEGTTDQGCFECRVPILIITGQCLIGEVISGAFEVEIPKIKTVITCIKNEFIKQQITCGLECICKILCQDGLEFLCPYCPTTINGEPTTEMIEANTPPSEENGNGNEN